MTFKHLMNELIEQGWRAYALPFPINSSNTTRIQAFAIRHLLEIRVYEGKHLVFVKTTQVKPEPKKPDKRGFGIDPTK